MDSVIVKKERVAEGRVRRGADVAGHAAATVRLVHEGDLVRAVEVLCACGDRITIELDYPAGAPNAPTAALPRA